MRRFLLIVCTLLVAWASTLAYVRRREDAGAARKWPTMPVVFELNHRGSIEISDGSDLAAARAAFATWDGVANSALAFMEDPTGLSDRDGFVDTHSTVVWVENASDPRVSPDTAAFTRVIADPGTGVISEADIVLNGVHFSWTTSGMGSYTTKQGPLDIQNTVTHETGHFIGFDHLTTRANVMFARQYPGQTSWRVLTQDEVSAVQFVYPSATPAVEAISGRVLRSGVAVPGAYVAAYQNGVPVVGVLTDATGNYAIKPIPPGSYLLRVQPYTNTDVAVSPFYHNAANVDVNFLSTLYPSSTNGRGTADETSPPSTTITVPSGGTVNGLDFDVATTASQNDFYEEDDTFGTAPATAIRKDGKAQIHHSWPSGDQDWVRLAGMAGCTYVIETRSLGLGATNIDNDTDTVLELYDQSGTVRLDTNPGDTESGDRNPPEGDLSSRIVRHETATAARFIKVAQFNGATVGAGAYFDLAVTEVCAGFPTPVVTSVEPSRATEDGGIVVTVRGSGFMPGAQVRFGIADATQENVQSCDVGLINCQAIRVLVPAHMQVQNEDMVSVEVTNRNGSVGSLPNGFTYARRSLGTFADSTFAAFGGFIGGGNSVCWGDYDSDGDQDVFRATGIGSTLRLLRNNGNSTFTAVTATAGLDTTFSQVSCAWGDYDNDGDLDLYVVYSGVANILSRNNGNGTFTDVTSNAVVGGVGGTSARSDASWVDFDQDGDLDLFLPYTSQSTGGSMWPHQLFNNNGDGTFIDVAPSAGLAIQRYCVEAKWADYDNDGFPDVYLVNRQAQSDQLFHNNRNRTFSDVTAVAGIIEDSHCASAGWADFNEDGLQDLFCASDSGNPSQNFRLWVNAGNGTFLDRSALSGIQTTSCTGRSVAVLDSDNDGDVDIYVGCDVNDRLLQNNGVDPPFFTDVAIASGVNETTFQRSAYGVGAADYNNDFHVDVLATGLESDADYLWQNSSNTNQGLTVRLEGTIQNSWGIGARVSVIPVLGGIPDEPTCLAADGSGNSRRQQVLGGSKNQNSMELEFGLGTQTIESREVDCVNVFWPRSGLRRAYAQVATNQTVALKEESANLLVTRVAPSSGPPSGGDLVTVYGFQFADPAKIYFGNLLATNIVYVSNNILTCTTPLHVAGVVDVRVENTPTVTSTLVGGYNYVGAGQEIDLRLAKVVAQGKVNLTWTDVNQGTYYRVRRALGPRPADFSPASLCTSLAGRSYSDAVLNDSVNYYYLVDATLTCP